MRGWARMSRSLTRFALTLYVHRVGSVRKKTVSAHPLRCPLLKERAFPPFSLGEKVGDEGWARMPRSLTRCARTFPASRSPHPLRCPLLKERAFPPFSLGEKGWG
jgi:hypothetical protein